jgi:pimeloyl-ACP methyl ester carboxylesterase
MKIIKINAVGFCLWAIMSAHFAVANGVADDIAESKTKSLPERHGKVSSQLFVGTAKNQPLIVGLGGSEGGNPWASNYWKVQREKFLAQGYAFLALGYFGTKESPAQLDRIALEAVHEAVMAAATDPLINGRCIALIGGSKGAELALTLASFYKEYGAVVAIVSGSAVFPALTMTMDTSSLSYQGKELAYVPFTPDAYPALMKRDLRAAFSILMENKPAMAEAAIKVENIQAPLLFLSAKKDEMWPSTEMSEQMMQRLKEKKFAYVNQHVAIEGGHAAPLKHFDVVEEFLNTNFRKTSGACAVLGSE